MTKKIQPQAVKSKKKVATPPAKPSRSPVKPVKAATKPSKKPSAKLPPEHVLPKHRVDLLTKAISGPHGKYVKILLDLRDQLLDNIDFHASDNLKRTQKDASSDLSAYSFHMADAGTDNFDREFALSMVSNEQEALYEINDAMKRLENNTFGVCEMCGKPIPRARLDAIPWTRYTVDCQSEVEKNQQRPSRQTFQLSDFGNSEEEAPEKEEES